MSSSSPHHSAPPGLDIIIVGAGAAGLATAIFTRRADRGRRVAVLDGARRPGAKILVSGGTRCNVTNRAVSERDFWGGRPPFVRRVLRAFTAADTVRFFADLGVPLHEEADGKLFPDSNRARDVLNALLQAVTAEGVSLRTDHRVLDIQPCAAGFEVHTSQGVLTCRQVVLATGGQSLPKSGSDGAGYRLAQQLGHTIVPTTPALAPLTLDGADGASMHRRLTGVAHQAELSIWIDGRIAIRLRGALLWTHFGISGPLALDASRHWLRARLDGRPSTVTLSFCPGKPFDAIDAAWTAAAAARPTSSVLSALGGYVAASVAAALLDALSIDPSRELAHLSRAERRAVVHALCAWPLMVNGSRGYNYAEATAGGVALDEVRMTTLESRVRRGLFLVGEILDVDGRLGGFNFQWAWSSAYVCGRALAGPAPAPAGGESSPERIRVR